MNLIGKFSIGSGLVILGLAGIKYFASANEAKWDAKVKIAEINARKENQEKKDKK